MTKMAEAMVIVLVAGSERNPAQHLGKLRTANRNKALLRSGGGTRVAQAIRNGDKIVRISARIAAPAHRRRDSPDSYRPISVYTASDVAQSIRRRRPWQIGRGVGPRRIPMHCVGRAQIESLLQRISQAPGSGLRAENPLL